VKRIRQDTKLAALSRSPLFEGLSRRQLALVARLSDDLDVRAGSVLCKEGSRGQEFFVIIDGEAIVTRARKHITTLRNGDYFGEIALLEPVRRTATVTALTPLNFFVISKQAFASLLNTDRTIERKMLRALARRFADLSQDPTLS
jgi:CRP-like cAMP-binding protein